MSSSSKSNISSTSSSGEAGVELPSHSGALLVVGVEVVGGDGAGEESSDKVTGYGGESSGKVTGDEFSDKEPSGEESDSGKVTEDEEDIQEVSSG